MYRVLVQTSIEKRRYLVVDNILEFSHVLSARVGVSKGAAREYANTQARKVEQLRQVGEACMRRVGGGGGGRMVTTTVLRVPMTGGTPAHEEICSMASSGDEICRARMV